MSGRIFYNVFALIALISAGCGKYGNASPRDFPAPTTVALNGETAATLQTKPEGKPQPRLPTIKLYVGTNEITAEIAGKPHEIETGMMWRTSLPEMEGMLFVFPQPEQRSFWMKNCPLPMTCAYISADGEILETRDMIPHDETGILSLTDAVQFVLEMNRGWFKKHNVNAGAVIATEHGPLRKTFYGR